VTLNSREETRIDRGWFVDGDNQISWSSTGGLNDVDILFDNNSGKGADNIQGLSMITGL